MPPPTARSDTPRSTEPNPHLTITPARHGADPTDAAAIVVAVHGRDQAPGYLLDHLVAPVEARLGTRPAAQVGWILPAAHDRSWYPGRLLEPMAGNRLHLDQALAALARIDQDLDGCDPGSVLWSGFSQGACLVTEHLARQPRRRGVARGGLAALTGAMVGPPGHPLVVDGELAGMPAYFGVGDADEWLPVWRVRETAEAYAAAGATVTTQVFADRPHHISPPEIDAVAELIATLLARPR